MTRTRKAHAFLFVAALVTLVVGSSWSVPTRSPWSTDAADADRGHRGFASAPGLDGDPRRPLASRAPSERADAWLAAHPPSSELRAALLDIAARADEVARPLPTTAPEDDAAAEALATARRERQELQEQFRVQLRAALRVMTAGERAALRAAHVHIIQLARHLASQRNG